MTANKLAIIEENLYRSDKSGLSLTQQEILLRLETAHSYMLDNPTQSRKKAVDLLMKKFKVDRSQAYRDIQLTVQLLGNVQNGAKAWHQYKAMAMAERNYELAEEDGNIKEMNAATRNYIEASGIKDAEDDRAKFDKVAVLPMEPSNDPSLLRGAKEIPNVNKKIEKMLKEYDKEIEIEDAIVIEEPELDGNE